MSEFLVAFGVTAGVILWIGAVFAFFFRGGNEHGN